jgi:hypothetical protein
MRFRIASIAVLAALLAVPAARADTPPAGSHYAGTRHVIVTINRSGLHPARITLSQEQKVGWLNYSGSPAQVILPGQAASHVACESVRPSFSRVARGELASRPVASPALILPCQLPPGTYAYRVVLVPGSGGILQGVAPTLNGAPLRTFTGELVVR